jgi:hypothetical protein
MYSLEQTPDPNIVLSDLTVPDFVQPTEDFQVSWTLTNQGTKDSSEEFWYHTVYLSRDKSIDFVDYRLGTIKYQEILQPSESYTIEQNFQIPKSYYADLDVPINIDPNQDWYLIVKTNLYTDDPYTGDPYNSYKIEPENKRALVVPLNLKPEGVDLTFSEINVPKVVKLNEPFTIDRTVVNQGNSKTSSQNWTDNVYLSTDKNIDIIYDYWVGYYDYVANTTTIDRPLDSSESYTLSDRVTIPSSYLVSDPIFYYDPMEYRHIDPNLDWYLLFQTDNNQDQGESNEENNLVAVPIDIESPTIDLVVSNITVTDPAIINNNNGEIEVSWTVSKQGEGNLPKDTSWLDKIYLSSDGVLSGGGEYDLGISENKNLLTNSDSYTVKKSFTLSKNVVAPDSHWYVIVETDFLDKIGETKNNNFWSENRENSNNYLSVPIDFKNPDLDLVVDRLDVPEHATVGEPLEISWTVKNQGTDNINFTGWEDTVFFSSDPILDVNSDRQLASIKHQETLAASGNYTQTRFLDIPQNAAKDIKVEIDKDGQPVKHGYLIVKTDNSAYTLETNEDNNTSVVPITLKLTQPDLAVNKLQIPKVVKLGDLVNFNWIVTNQEPISVKNNNLKYEAYLSTYPDDYPSGYGYNLGTINNQNRIYASSTLWGNGQWRIPDNNQYPELDPNQDWWFFLKVDSDDRLKESDETNNFTFAAIELVNNTIDGTTGDDKIVGSSGKDFIRGFAGRDAIDAGIGNDLIVDGLGRDTLTGGKGIDDFVFKQLDTSNNVITDFNRDYLVLTELLDSLSYPDSTTFEDGYMQYMGTSQGVEKYLHSNGYLQLAGNSHATIVSVDSDGFNGKDGWHELVRIENISPANVMQYDSYGPKLVL